MNTDTKHRVLSVLQHHIGQHNGIASEALAREVQVSPRDVRLIVTDLRMDGVAVCGTPRDGYFIAATVDELEATTGFLRSRAMHSLLLESRLRKVALIDLIGQLKLNT